MQTKSIKEMNDGVYFIADQTCEKTYVRNYVQLTPDVQVAPPDTKYIGVKMGNRAIAVALNDLPGNADGGLWLLPRGRKSPAASEHYSWDSDRYAYRFNIFEDFNGKENTERLKSYGCQIQLPEETWIPGMGEIGLLMMNLSAVNKALEMAGGQPLKVWYWSSTEYSQNGAWNVYFSDGYTYISNKYNSVAVRAVAAF